MRYKEDYEKPVCELSDFHKEMHIAMCSRYDIPVLGSHFDMGMASDMASEWLSTSKLIIRHIEQ